MPNILLSLSLILIMLENKRLYGFFLIQMMLENKTNTHVMFATRFFTSNKALNGHMRCHSQKGITNTPTAPPSSIDDQFLPPKKRQALRRKRYMDIDDEVTAAAETLLHISREGYEGSTANIDVNHSGAKRQKIPRNMDLNELPSDDFEVESN